MAKTPNREAQPKMNGTPQQPGGAAVRNVSITFPMEMRRGVDGNQVTCSRFLTVKLSGKAMYGLRLLIDGREAIGSQLRKRNGAVIVNDVLEACFDAFQG